jgi:hypothetical protein
MINIEKGFTDDGGHWVVHGASAFYSLTDACSRFLEGLRHVSTQHFDH